MSAANETAISSSFFHSPNILAHRLTIAFISTQNKTPSTKDAQVLAMTAIDTFNPGTLAGSLAP
jgi:hypothetical protein